MVYKTLFVVTLFLQKCLLVSAIVLEEDAVTKPPKRWENLPWPIPMNRDEYSRHASGANVGQLWFPPEHGAVTGTIVKDTPKPGEITSASPEERKNNWEIIPDPNSEGGFRLIKKPPSGSVFTNPELSNIINTENNKGNYGSPYVLGTGLSSADNPRPGAGVLEQGNGQERPSVDRLASGMSSGSFLNSGVSVATDQLKPSTGKLGSYMSSGAVIGTGVSPGSVIKTPSSNVLGKGVSSGANGAPSQQGTYNLHMTPTGSQNEGSWNHGLSSSVNNGQSSSIGSGVSPSGQGFEVKPGVQWGIHPVNSDQTSASSSSQQFMPAYHWNSVSAVVVPATSSHQSPLLGDTLQPATSSISSFDVEKCPAGATGQFVYLPDCRRFLNCWKGRGFTQVCAPGTLFNPETLECDFPSKVKCLPMTPQQDRWNNIQVNSTVERHLVRESRVLEVTETPTSTVAPPVQSRKTDCPMEGGTGLAPHPTDCRKFFNCWKGTAHSMQCGPGTLFNPLTLLCDFPYNVNCVVTTSNTPAPGKLSPNKPNQPVKPITQAPKPTSTTTIRTTPAPSRTSTTVKTTHRPTPPPTIPTTEPTTTVPPATTKSAVDEKKKRNPSGQVLRLRGGPGPWEGYIEVQEPEGGWGLVCDDRNSWTIAEANVVCRQLGYERGAELSWQGRPLRPTEDTLRVAVNRVSCGGNEVVFSSCELTRGQECVIARDAVGLRCYKNWVSQCQPGEVNYDRKCYKLIVPSVRYALEGFSHGEALRDCKRRGSQLLDITSQEENDFISEWLIQLEPNISNILTSGVGLSVPERSLWVWEGSVTPFRFTKWWPGWTNELVKAPKTGDRPICIVAKRLFPCEHAYYTSEGITDIDAHSHEHLKVRMCAANYFYWHTEDCSITHSHPYICERPIDDVGCLNAESQNYRGTANVTASGLPCIKWDDPSVVTKIKYRISERERLANFVDHNYCRNVGNEVQPWCYAGKKRTREPCDIPSCWGKAVEKVVVVQQGCTPHEFDCLSGECIPQSWHCDGEKDCRNGQDELNCGGLYEEFTKNGSHRLQGHDVEKWLKTSAKICAKHCKEAKDFVCRSFSHHARDSVCLLSDSNIGLSGGLVAQADWDYYEMKSHTVVCDDKFQCDNGKCLNVSKVCNGKNDCGDRSDEKNCTAEYIGYEIRLAGSNVSNEGRIEVKAFGRWGLICDDLFGLRDAEVICRDVGYSLGAVEVLPPGSYISHDHSDDKIFLVDDLQCLGNESSLLECEFEGWGIHDCLPEEAVSVVCSVPGLTCAANFWQCETSKECLPIAYLCDNIQDCDDGSDEDPNRCNSPVELRLAGGPSNMEGRVEVRYRGIWGTICDDDFAIPAATVICRSLGYNGLALAKKDGAYGSGEGQIWLDQLHCSGNETGIVHCVHAQWGENNCQHNEDAGVVCSVESRQSVNGDKQVEWTEETNNIPVSRILPSQCGTRDFDRLNELDNFKARVVGGNEVHKGSYPWQASVRVRTGGKSVHWCGAVIISPLHILTAGHCLQDYSKGAYFIRVGDHDTEEREGTEQELNIDEYYLHEEFNVGRRLNHDIAVVKLKGLGIQLGPDITPACLPQQGIQFTPGLNCTISGWGSMKAAGSGYSRRLRAAWIPLLPHETCRAGFVYGSNAIGEGMFCAGNLEGGVDSCQGDSGGPIICLINGEFTLYGITSWGHGCGRPNKPGVYSNVGYYREWIDRKLEDSMSGR